MVGFSAPSARPGVSSSSYGRAGFNAKGSGKGKKWEAGKKLYANQVYHNSTDVMSRYAGKTRELPNGDSSAVYECMAKPQVLASPQALGDILEAYNTELINRPGIGFSELAGSLLSWLDVVQDLGQKKVFHKDFVAHWQKLAEEHSLRESCELLNAQDYPDLERTSAGLSGAVKKLLQFANEIRRDWPRHAAIQGLGCSAWDVPTECTEAKAALMRKPESGNMLVAYISAEVHASHNVRLKKESLHALQADTQLLFSESEKGTPQKPKSSWRKAKASLREEMDVLLSTVVPPETQKKKAAKLFQKFKDYNEKVAEVLMEYQKDKEAVFQEEELGRLKAKRAALKKIAGGGQQ
ncbi:unnamed protein product [Symbiodinium sp. CCMP2592]|nr:unnamed protein product [Symbiodinium sp. CCMP2592]